MVEQIWLNRGTIQFVVIGLLFLISVFKGARPEIAVSGFMLAVQIVDRIYHRLYAGGVSASSYSSGHEVDYGHLVFDVIGLFVFVILALKSNRVFTLWISGWQIICVIAHFSRSIMPHMHPIAYAIMERTRNTASNVLVRGLKWEIVRRYSNV